MHVKQLLTTTVLIGVAFMSTALAVKTDDLPPEDIGIFTRLPDPPKVSELFKSPIVAVYTANSNMLSSLVNKKVDFFKFIWAGHPASMPSLCILNDSGGSYLQLTSKSDNISEGVWLMPALRKPDVPNSINTFEVSADISFIPDNLDADKSPHGEVSFMPTYINANQNFIPDIIRNNKSMNGKKSIVVATSPIPVHVVVRVRYSELTPKVKQHVTAIGFYFSIKGHGVGEIRNITIKNELLQSSVSNGDKTKREFEIFIRSSLEAISLEKDLAKKTALEKRDVGNYACARLNSVLFPALDKLGAYDSAKHDDIKLTAIREEFEAVSQPLQAKFLAAFNANDLEKAEGILVEGISAIKQKCTQNNLPIEDWQLGFLSRGLLETSPPIVPTLTELAQKHKANREK